MKKHELIDSMKRCGLTVDPNTLIATYFNLNITPSNSYYFIVSGPVPIKTAYDLYNHRLRKDIRIAGHIGNVPPEHPWISHYHNGKKVLTKNEVKPYNTIINDPEVDEDTRQAMKKGLEKIHVDDSKLMYPPFVDLYHIDSELALYVFLEHIRNSNQND